VAAVWSKPAALRAIRATIVVPGLFAICYEVIGNLQMATFARSADSPRWCWPRSAVPAGTS